MKHIYNKARLMWSLIGLAILGLYGGGKYYIDTLKADESEQGHSASSRFSYSMIVLNDKFFNSPEVDDKPLDLTDYNLVLLKAEDISRDIIIKCDQRSKMLLIGSAQDNKVMHTIKSISTDDCPLSAVIKSFFALKSIYPRLYVIKDLYNNHAQTPDHLISTLIEQGPDSGIILTECSKTQKSYKAYWDNTTQSLSAWIPISSKEKNELQTQLVRKYAGLRSLESQKTCL